MRRSLILTAVAALGLTGPALAQQAVPIPTPVRTLPSAGGPDYAAVLASPIRTDEDRARDEARQTALIVDFTGVRPGWKVADMIIGGGYFTRIFSAAVGPEGHVTAWQPDEFIGFQASYGEALTAADALPNVEGVHSPIGAPVFPEGLDLVFTAQNYHDLHLQPFPADTAAKVNAAVFAALKPGGSYVIIDHHAVDGSDLSVAQTLHRIDESTVIREVEAAGFEFAGAAAALWNDDDPRTANVFDASIRGHTSQFTLRFRKPE
ncbi:class I SAM-dependent methyltransferase [Brevundimonas sp. FT23042]|uniref:class I SAM-dependent methyltransferase n=1 Tax=Brevundimonas sp. FT23042 TaxID=3393749 RepID=UPI003B5889EB